MATVLKAKPKNGKGVARADLKLEITALKDDGPDFFFVLQSRNLPPGYKECGGALRCKANKPARFEFILKDAVKKKLNFAQKPFRVREGFDCPPEDSGIWPGFEVVEVKNDKLVVEYEGSPENTIFSYALSFDGPNGLAEFDPIIINRN